LDAFNPPRDRDAWAAIRGFVYQVDLTIRRWLNLAADEILELERGEDIDLVSSSFLAGAEESARQLEQVKHREQPITLLSPAAIFAIACALEHRSANLHAKLRFRFTTNARVGKERFSHHPRPCIHVWEDIRSGKVAEDSLPDAVASIRTILGTATKPGKVHAEAWAVFLNAINHGSDAELLSLIRAFEWGTGSEAASSLGTVITRSLLAAGKAADLQHARGLYERLFLHVFKAISREGIKRLTTSDLSGLLALPTLSESDRLLLESVALRLMDVESRLAQGEWERRQQGAVIEQLDVQMRTLAKRQGVLASMAYTAEDIDLEIPAPCSHLSPRESAVALVRQSVAGHAWTAIHGGSCVGKTQLTALVARSLEHLRGWIRLRDLGQRQAAWRVDLAIGTICGVPVRAGRRGWYRDALGRLGPGSLIVLEDLPRLTGGDPLCERLLRLAAAAHDAQTRLLTTSWFPLSPSVRSAAPLGAVNALEMPAFRDADARALLRSLGAPESLLGEQFVASISNLARRHPLLLDAIGRYLAQRQWRFRVEEFGDILEGRHAEEVGREIISRLLHTVEDHLSRQLLYRLTLVIGYFSAKDAVALAAVDPALDRPRERLDAVTGPWVQISNRGQLLLSPLIDAVGSDDLPRKAKRKCLLRLGSRVIRRGRMGPEDLCKAVTYFTRAKAFNRSGLLLIQALTHLNSMDEQVDPRDILTLWHGVSLPGRVDLGLRLYLRALQYRVRRRYGRTVDGLLGDVDQLSQLATQREGWAVLGAAVLLVGHLGDVDRLLGFRLLRRAFQLTTDFRTYADQELVWPDGVGPEWMIWSVAGELSSEEELYEWRETVEALGPEQRHKAFKYKTAEPGCLIVAGALYRAELKKPDEQRRWDHVLVRIDELASWAMGLGLELLWASAVRHRVIVLGENLGQTQKAVNAARQALNSASDDPRVRFLLSDTIGSFLLRDGKPAEALEWLERALVSATDGYTVERLLLMVNASRATAVPAPERSLDLLRDAGRLAREDEDLPEIEAARILGEIAIGEGLAGHFLECFQALEGGVQRLLSCKADTNTWQILLVLFGHTSGYFTSLAYRGSPPDSTPAGEEYAQPRRGVFYTYTEGIVKLYDASRDYTITLQLAIFADAVDDDVRAAAWVAKALELAPGAGQQVEEITRKFVPQLVLEDRYADAMEAALGYGAILTARSIEKQAGSLEFPADIDVATILGDRPNLNWQQAERWAALFGLIPAVVRLCKLAIEKPQETGLAAREIVLVCRQIGAGASDPLFWESLAEIIEKALIEPIGAKAYRTMMEELDTSVTTTPKMIAMLLFSVQPGLPAEEALDLHLSILPALTQHLDRPFSAYRRLLVPFIAAYWNTMFRRMRFRFCTPDLVQQALSAADSVSADHRIEAVIRAILIGIPLDLPPRTRAWLDTKSGRM
jgi:tetratricopeptide (TPR) repeat protein